MQRTARTEGSPGLTEPSARIGSDLPASPDWSPGKVPEELEAAIREADHSLCRLQGAATSLPTPDGLVRMQIRCESIATCCIDGIDASLADLLSLEADIAPSKRAWRSAPAERCIQSLDAALDSDRDLVFSTDRLAEIAAILMGPENLAEGEPEGEPVSSTPAAPSAATQPESAGGIFLALPGALGSESGLPAVVRAGLALATVELAGSFGPSSGRVGRLLATAALTRHAGTPVRLSGHLRRHASEYRLELESSRRSGSWDCWIGFFAQAVAAAADESTEEVRRFASLREQTRNTLAGGLGYALPKGLLVLDRLFVQPVASVSDVQQLTKTSYVAANALVRRLAKLGVLEEVTGHRRNRVFWFGEYARLFETGSPESSRVPPVRPRAIAQSARGRDPGIAPQARTPPVASRPKPPPAVRRRPGPGIADHLL